MENILSKIIVLWLIASQSAWAHSPLHHSEPAHGAVLGQSPSNIVLAFGDKAHLVKLTLVDQMGQPIDIAFQPVKGKTFNIPLTNVLKPSLYQINWMILGTDAHKVKGSFNFSVSQ